MRFAPAAASLPLTPLPMAPDGRPHDVSPTRMRLYAECPRAYRARYLDGVDGAAGPEAETGKLVHRVLERAARARVGPFAAGLPPVPTLAELLATLGDDGAADLAVHLAARRVLELVAPRLGPLDRVVAIEEPWVLDVAIDGGGSVRAAGVWDRVDDEGSTGDVVVVDYKTGRYVPTVGDFEADPQPLLYAAAAHARWPDREVRVVFRYLARDAEHELAWSPEVDQVARAAARATALALRAETTWTPTPGRWCVRCPVRDRCEARERLLASGPPTTLPASATADELVRERRRLATLAALAEDARLELDERLRALVPAHGALRADGCEVRLRSSRRYSYPDRSATVSAASAAAGCTSAAAETALTEITSGSVKRWLEALPAERRKAVEHAVTATAAVTPTRSFVEVRVRRDDSKESTG